ncbi:hypothetical protein GWI33_006683 [Rhynchophorus ferrugineus]|uniref:Uncharacterized protein n=1 Tax=Rhynchophorus ferrugineus TaxID=354439 RepID=A0A834MH50_RHYFE|nr:hypothetical protein GWI33_006683 [Rhynchophorus ferrugineus]
MLSANDRAACHQEIILQTKRFSLTRPPRVSFRSRKPFKLFIHSSRKAGRAHFLHSSTVIVYQLVYERAPSGCSEGCFNEAGASASREIIRPAAVAYV